MDFVEVKRMRHHLSTLSHRLLWVDFYARFALFGGAGSNATRGVSVGWLHFLPFVRL